MSDRMDLNNKYKKHLVDLLRARGYSQYATVLERATLITVHNPNDPNVKTAAANANYNLIYLNTSLNLDNIKVTITHEILHLVFAHYARQKEYLQRAGYKNATTVDPKSGDTYLKRSHGVVGNIVGDVNLAAYQSPSDQHRILTFSRDKGKYKPSGVQQYGDAKHYTDNLEISRGLIGDIDIPNNINKDPHDYDKLLQDYIDNLNMVDSETLPIDYER